ncbi:TPA: hypothetical protein I8010_002850 [Legionella pneumophila]|nr:hypothetical protein [Legionella pneumophila]HAT1995067.1 hypothetical protein [Legionella pneumophila]HAT2052648.1 hypothetical protein [Legionella pneumophila]HAT2061874.1 hypothetical protein [Legionella pneumophila]
MRDYWDSQKLIIGLAAAVSVVGFLDEGLLPHGGAMQGLYGVSVVGFLDEGLLVTLKHLGNKYKVSVVGFLDEGLLG